ncbi:S13-like H2TH domain-containing protein [Cantharellus anzutake]|uniref:S13-like H2TH domain-containing protein n=1 Tax=Cantharellus anzutake TaxID=1750568 RepID=UPI001906DA0B|nr:S13-like H2TH domain-containing protein [Cantharellus anzutake]KAF8343892.1 S13-like H2TH domain-containing protein [Cantharellus anzutake]
MLPTDEAITLEGFRLILGRQLPDGKALKIALTAFYGIGRHTAERVMARYSIHNTIKVGELTQAQITCLTSFLSSPATSPRPILPGKTNLEHIRPNDPLADLKIETELRKAMLDNIAHHRAVGSYVGRRHAMALPVRGQHTRNNAQTAKKLNRIERKR